MTKIGTTHIKAMAVVSVVYMSLLQFTDGALYFVSLLLCSDDLFIDCVESRDCCFELSSKLNI